MAFTLYQECTLRAAIEQANYTLYNSAGRDQIIGIEGWDGGNRVVPGDMWVNSEADGKDKKDNNLADGVCWTGEYLPNAGPVTKISLKLPLDTITQRVSIFGGVDANQVPMTEVEGSGAGVANGFVIEASGTTIHGLGINSFSENGVLIRDSDRNIIELNFIGTNRLGTAKAPNGKDGVRIENGNWNYIGNGPGDDETTSGGVNSPSTPTTPSTPTPPAYPGTTPGTILEDTGGGTTGGGTTEGGGGGTGGAGSSGNFLVKPNNVISGNVGNGIAIEGVGNWVWGNYIGTDRLGSLNLGNGINGVQATRGSALNGFVENIISGNDGNGVHLQEAPLSLIEGNYIGVDKNGTASLGLQDDGILLSGASSDVTVRRNVVSGNTLNGVHLTGEDPDRARIFGNMIGVSVGGATKVANLKDGIRIEGGSDDHIIGVDGWQLDMGASNIVSGNGLNGIHIIDGMRTRIQGNYIGTNEAKSNLMPNDKNGILIEGSASHILIGVDEVTPVDALDADTLKEINFIAGNGKSGIRLETAVENVIIAGNEIGFDVGTTTLGNGEAGITVLGASNMIGTDGDGKEDVRERNRIKYNLGNGIYLLGPTQVVAGNEIDANEKSGVFIEASSSQNRIGTDANGSKDSDESNLIVRNKGFGVHIKGMSAVSNRVSGNYIGTNEGGAANLGNRLGGVMLDATKDNRVGTNGDNVEDVAERNVISGNVSDSVGTYVAGVTITGGETNFVSGNLIGLNKQGTSRIANDVGVVIDGGATKNFVDLGNVISGNYASGVKIAGLSTTENVIQNNRIGTSADGSTDLGNGARGVLINASKSNVIDGNIIAGNDEHGVQLTNGSQYNKLWRNRIGISIKPTGNTVPLPNGVLPNDPNGKPEFEGSGVVIDSASVGNLVGEGGKGNTISRNTGHGVFIKDYGTSKNLVIGNYIGTDTFGISEMGNRQDGVRLSNGATENAVGTNGDGTNDNIEGNVISGNELAGIRIQNSSTSANSVAGNYIGLAVDGLTIIANQSSGVIIETKAKNNRIGTDGNSVSDSYERNIISGNAYHGVHIHGLGTTNNRVAGNFIGTDKSGLRAKGNAQEGVRIENSATTNVIGTNGDGAGDGNEWNVISGNSLAGVRIAGDGTNQNIVAGNLIGMGTDGVTEVPNAKSGVILESKAESNRIGTDGDGKGDIAERNTISGNTEYGIYITGLATNANRVSGNYIGTDKNGGEAKANVQDGIRIDLGAKFNVIGTNGNGSNDDIEGNIISGNKIAGVRINGEHTEFNVTAGNTIGLGASGAIAIANQFSGVIIEGKAANNRVGTDGDGVGDIAERNIISGNTEYGIYITGLATNANRISGNYIGTDKTGGVAKANMQDGIRIDWAAKFNIIGTNGDGSNDEQEGNLISGNMIAGVRIGSVDTESNVTAGNIIGLDSKGTSIVANQFSGVIIEGKATNNRIGTDGDGVGDIAERNVVSGNKEYGILISGEGTNDNHVSGNYIGTDKVGTASKKNELSGVKIEGKAKHNIIGTNGDNTGDASEGNVVSGNMYFGIHISGDGTESNIVAGNLIGLTPDGMSAVPNEKDGVLIEAQAKLNRIGTDGDGISDSNDRNVISGNNDSGIRVTGDGTTKNVIAGNWIGVQIDGKSDLGNGVNGVRIAEAASKNRIGSDGDGSSANDIAEGNIIAWNGKRLASNALGLKGFGVAVASDLSIGNSIQLNSIFSNKGRGIDLGDDSFTLNDIADNDSGANSLQDYPTVIKTGPSGVITWQLESKPNTDYKIDFYANDQYSPSGFGDGKRFLKQIKVTTSSPVAANGTTPSDPGGIAVFTELFFSLSEKYISATATDPDGNTSEFSMVDTDGDALADAWEIAAGSIDINEDNITDLILPGRSSTAPYTRTLYVEVDGMKGFSPKDLPKTVAAFGNAGITLSLELEGINPSPPTQPTPATPWTDGNSDKWPDEFDQFKLNNWGTANERKHANWTFINQARRLVYRYAVFAESWPVGWSGVAELDHDTPSLGKTIGSTSEIRPLQGGNDFIMFMGNWTNPTSDDYEGTFMHEFGHTLGLRHGGDDNNNFKPNYQSVMSYTWQTPTFPDGTQRTYGPWKLDYSHTVLDPLDEKNLDELDPDGIGGRPNVQTQIRTHYTNNGWMGQDIPEDKPVDWNNDGFYTGTFTIDVNLDNQYTVLTGYDDWSNLMFYWRETVFENDATPQHTGAARGMGSGELFVKSTVHVELPQALLKDSVPPLQSSENFGLSFTLPMRAGPIFERQSVLSYNAMEPYNRLYVGGGNLQDWGHSSPPAPAFAKQFQPVRDSSASYRSWVSIGEGVHAYNGKLQTSVLFSRRLNLRAQLRTESRDTDLEAFNAFDQSFAEFTSSDRVDKSSVKEVSNCFADVDAALQQLCVASDAELRFATLFAIGVLLETKATGREPCMVPRERRQKMSRNWRK